MASGRTLLRLSLQPGRRCDRGKELVDDMRHTTSLATLNRVDRPEALLVVEPQPLMCDALNLTLRISLTPHAMLVAHGLDEALALIRDYGAPDAVILDLCLPDARGTEAIMALRRHAPHAPLAVFSADLRPDVITAALAAGAQGYIGKDATRENLVDALRRIWSGQQVVPPDFDPDDDSAATAHKAELAAKFARLTPQQIAILRLICAGQSNADIANALSISEATVKTHVTALLARIGAQNRIQALLLAHRVMLFELG